MRSILFAALLLINLSAWAKIDERLFPEWGLSFQGNSNAMVYRPRSQNPDGNFQTSNYLSPGFGAYTALWKDDVLWIVLGANYQTRGSGDLVYIHDISTNRVNDVDERFQSITSDIQFRYQFKTIRIKPFIGIGIGMSNVIKTRNGIIRGNNTDDLSEFLFPNAQISKANNYRRTTTQAIAAIGANINNLASLEFSIHHDIQPVLKNDISIAWLWTNSVTIRINVAELIRRENQKNKL